MRVVVLVIVGLACARSEPPTISNTSQTPDVKVADEAEWRLLAPVYANPDDMTALGALAELYSRRGAWDEYSAVRSRMLLLLPPRTTGPVPGGPFPRIGVPRSDPRPTTVLGRWINPTDLPELYGKPEVSAHELAIQLKASKNPDVRRLVRIGDAVCADLMFAIAEVYYERALRLDPDHKRARERLADLQRMRDGK